MRACLALAIGLSVAQNAAAHDGIDHASASEARAHAAEASAPRPPGPLPFALGGPFTLEASTGGTRTEADPDGRMQLLFFGYASCEQICSATLPMMADVVERAKADGIDLRPLMVTVDPARDTPATMAARLPAFHPDFVGLTGEPDALRAAYEAFSIQTELVMRDADGGAVFAHGSFVYLLDARGTVLTLIPPVMDAAGAADIVLRYADGA